MSLLTSVLRQSLVADEIFFLIFREELLVMCGTEKVARATFVRKSSRQSMKLSTFICSNIILHERAASHIFYKYIEQD